MKRIHHSLIFVLLAVAVGYADVTVTNLVVLQREGTKLVDIVYDVFNDSDSVAAVRITLFDGTSEIDHPSLTGDFGSTVAVGVDRHAIWNGGADLNNQITPNLVVTVSVTEPAQSDMVLVPAGTNSASDPDFGNYSVSSASNLYAGATEVSKSTWDSVYSWATGNGYTFKGLHLAKGPSHPITNVDWYDCIVWCNARSALEGLTACYTDLSDNPVKSSYSGSVIQYDTSADGYRLPTSSEWEFMARGGESGQRFPWGYSITHTNANYQSDESYSYDLNFDLNGYDGYHDSFDSGGYPYTSPGGSFDPNGLGLYDMAGNVWEWCWTSSGSARAQRSGSWAQFADEARCGSVDYVTPDALNNVVGFRTVRNISTPVSQAAVISFDARDYELAIASDYGAPVPSVGTNGFAWKASVTCSVEAVVLEGGTNFTCTGWSGGGSVPASGTSTGIVVVLNDLFSTLVWNWVDEDADQDGMDDDWERLFFGDLDQAATNDFDGDGQSDFSEYIAGTIPTNAASLFKLTTSFSGPGSFVIEWPTASNRIYNVYGTDNLQYNGFQAIETNIAYPRHSATSTAAAAQSYFKLDVTKP